jgi:hypothetical protein
MLFYFNFKHFTNKKLQIIVELLILYQQIKEGHISGLKLMKVLLALNITFYLAFNLACYF